MCHDSSEQTNMNSLPPALSNNIRVRDLLLIALTFSSGAVDAISFLALGKVFTAFMTGNLVFVGFGAAGVEGPDVARAALAIGVFGAGVALATSITGESGGPRLWP